MLEACLLQTHHVHLRNRHLPEAIDHNLYVRGDLAYDRKGLGTDEDGDRPAAPAPRDLGTEQAGRRARRT